MVKVISMATGKIEKPKMEPVFSPPSQFSAASPILSLNSYSDLNFSLLLLKSIYKVAPLLVKTTSFFIHPNDHVFGHSETFTFTSHFGN